MEFQYNKKTLRLERKIETKKKSSKRPKIIVGIFILGVSFFTYKFFLSGDSSLGEKEIALENEIIETSQDESGEAQVLGEEQYGMGGGPAEKVEVCTVSEGDIPAEIFSEYGKLDANDTVALLKASEDVYDFTKVKIGQDLRFYFNGEDRAERVEYEKNTEEIIIAERNGDEFSVREEKINYEVNEAVAKGVIDNFFYADALEAGLSEPTVLEVGDLFSYSIDFTTEIRKGDEFSFVYEKRKRDGQIAPDGRILAAKFINDGSTHYAYYFNNDGEGGYYDEEGRVLERQFLRAPLSFSRITSGYTGSRLHPITRTVTAHYQIDYAAPTGTPVSSTARGTVTSAGWENGWGYIVRVRHDNGYTTHYGHLSSFASGIKAGTRVSQGQIVGFVGSTGWSTGPHLDYGMRLNGSPVNPLKLDLPKGEPLAESIMPAFEEVKNKYISKLE